MHSEWKLKEDKGDLSKLIKQVASGDVQLVTVHGRAAFAGRILALDATALHVWAQITARAELAGQLLPVI